MYNYKNVFSKIKTPESWKENLYAKLEEERLAEEDKHTEKRPVMLRKTVAAVLSAAAVIAVTVTAAALTGLLDLGTVMENSFDDSISAAKLAEGNYQPLDISAENDIMSITAAAFVGDAADSYILAEAKLKEGAPDDFTRFGLNVIVFDDSADEETIGSFAVNRYIGTPRTDENGETVYVFRIRCYPYWTGNASKNGIELIANIVGAYFDNKGSEDTEWSTVKPADMRLSFVPDRDIVGEREQIKLDRAFAVNGIDCIAHEFEPSDYCVRLCIEYAVPDGFEPLRSEELVSGYEALSQIISNAVKEEECGRYLLGITDGKFSPELCPVKLLVDGEYVPYLGNDIYNYEDDYQTTLNEPYTIGYHRENEYEEYRPSVMLYFEPFDLGAASSVVFETDAEDGTAESIVVK